jgi:hypothetical protein
MVTKEQLAMLLLLPYLIVVFLTAFNQEGSEELLKVTYKNPDLVLTLEHIDDEAPFRASTDPNVGLIGNNTSYSGTTTRNYTVQHTTDALLRSGPKV